MKGQKMAKFKVTYRLENKNNLSPNGVKCVKYLSNVRGTTESAVMSELRRRVCVDDKHTLVLMDYQEL